MQLVAYGAQDIYLTGNPQITFFKVVYRRHTNFAMEAIEQTFNGSVDYSRKLSCTLDRNGDLVHRMYLEIDLGGDTVAGNADVHDVPVNGRLGHSLINEVEVEIGGQMIDKHYGEWLEIWSQLTCTDEELTKLRLMIDGGIRDTSVAAMASEGTDDKKIYVPLQFWFNRNPGLALPLIALQYHEVKINLLLNSRVGAGIDAAATINSLNQISLFCDYIFLDTDERRRFAQVSHEYLIEQLQFNNIVSCGATESQKNVELRFNHPCKELIWVAQPQTTNVTAGGTDASSRFDFSNQGAGASRSNKELSTDTVLKAKLQLNGHDRFRERDGSYFRSVQMYQHHTGGHRQWNYTTNVVDSKQYGIKGVLDGSIYCYSFALKPEEHQPSGTCNFSRIDNAVLQLTLNTIQSVPTANTSILSTATTVSKYIKVYAVNYNVLRIMSGMGGLAYSN